MQSVRRIISGLLRLLCTFRWAKIWTWFIHSLATKFRTQRQWRKANKFLKVKFSCASSSDQSKLWHQTCSRGWYRIAEDSVRSTQHITNHSWQHWEQGSGWARKNARKKTRILTPSFQEILRNQSTSQQQLIESKENQNLRHIPWSKNTSYQAIFSEISDSNTEFFQNNQCNKTYFTKEILRETGMEKWRIIGQVSWTSERIHKRILCTLSESTHRRV